MFVDGDSARVSERVVGRPAGGFVLVAVVQLVMAWYAYRERLIRLRDLRVWFALWEVRERRCKLESGREPTYRETEILQIVGGVGTPGIRSAFRRLERAGLGVFNERTISFSASPEDLKVESLDGIFSMLQKIENRGRRIPVPRRALQLIAGGARPVVIATMLGVMMRCLYGAKSGTISGGRIKSSWVADVFGVDLRRVKAARRHLKELGWMSSFGTVQWKENRWGRGVLVNLEWSRDEARNPRSPATESVPPSSSLSTSELPPPEAVSTSELPPPCLNQTLPLRGSYENQKPASGGPTGSGACASKGEEELPKPKLSNVLKEDLRNAPRLLELFEQAEARGLVSGSEASRLQFFAIAEHAAVIGSRNPAGLFISLVKRKLWHFATQADEDAAVARMKRHLLGDDEPRSTRSLDDEDVASISELMRGSFGGCG